MKTLQTSRMRLVVGLVLALLVILSGVLTLNDGRDWSMNAAFVERPHAPIPAESASDSLETTEFGRTMPLAPNQADTRAHVPTVVENRMTDKAREAARAVRSLGSGEASYYGAAFAGRPTASGEPFNPADLTAAHRTLPFGSTVRVTNVRNGRSVIVTVNDRGPYADNRVIDLSRGAADRIGMIQSGTADVRLELIS